MAIIDLSTNIGLLRLRLGDVRDIPILGDDILQSAIDQKNGNLKAATKLCANYILAQLAFRSDQTMGIITVHGSQVFQQYKEYIMLLTKDPNISDISPLPYSGTGEQSPIVRFTKNWDKGCCQGSTYGEWIAPL